jgi:hypothetical protein
MSGSGDYEPRMRLFKMIDLTECLIATLLKASALK